MIQPALTVDDIARFYKRDLQLVDQEMQKNLETFISPIYTVGMHIFRSGGKRIRPLLVILSSRLSGYNKGGDEIILANIIETIHTASLLHDDVVDGSPLRRGKPVANSIWGNQVVILVGDFLYSNALRVASSLKNIKIIEILSMVISSMTRGELLELQKIGDIRINENDYLRIIEDKTANLMSAACQLGAVISNVSPEKEKALYNFGLKLGLTFQFVDDILDFMADEKELGKKLGNDLREGKITYPLIKLLKMAKPDEIQAIEKVIAADTIENGKLSYVLELLDRYMAIEKSYEKARSIIEEAKQELNIFEDSHEKNSLLAIADYALNRDK
jgi:octaprenyl-diphosphate synthase